jgi:hypothetical protein
VGSGEAKDPAQVANNLAVGVRAVVHLVVHSMAKITP